MLKVANSVISASRITGVLPVVNGGTGVTTSTGTGNTVLSASPTLSGDVNLSTGNLVIGTSGKGIDFSVTSSGSGTMTSELLADYEEGTWTPSLGGTTTYLYQLGYYTKIGNVCYFVARIGVTLIGTGSKTTISGQPFSALYNGANGFHATYYEGVDSLILSLIGYVNTTSIVLQSNTAAANSVGPFNIYKDGAQVSIQGWFFV
jgi:hypothetical protein